MIEIVPCSANRKVKALTSTKFGSQSSEMNRIGATVPNTNLHAVEGSNPIWSMEERLPQDDNVRFVIRFVNLKCFVWYFVYLHLN